MAAGVLFLGLFYSTGKLLKSALVIQNVILKPEQLILAAIMRKYSTRNHTDCNSENKNKGNVITVVNIRAVMRAASNTIFQPGAVPRFHDFAPKVGNVDSFQELNCGTRDRIPTCVVGRLSGV